MIPATMVVAATMVRMARLRGPDAVPQRRYGNDSTHLRFAEGTEGVRLKAR